MNNIPLDQSNQYLQISDTGQAVLASKIPGASVSIASVSIERPVPPDALPELRQKLSDPDVLPEELLAVVDSIDTMEETS